MLQVIRSLDPRLGGPAKVVSELADLLPISGVETKVVTSNHERLFVESKLSQKSLDNVYFHSVLPVPGRMLATFGLSAENVRWMRRELRSFDVVHFHGLFDSFAELGMRLCQSQSMPYVVSPWGLLGDWALKQRASRKRAFISLMTRRNLEAAAVVQFSTPREAAEFENTLGFDVRSAVLPAGVDFSESDTLAKDEIWAPVFGPRTGAPRVIFLSRLHEKKGLYEFLDACGPILGDVQLIIAGTGDEQYVRRCQGLVDSQGLDSSVKFVGHLAGEEKRAAFQHADIFVLPSFSESQGIVVLEAIAAGCFPVVGAAVAMADYFPDFEYGLVHDYSKDAIRQGLVQAIERLPDRSVRAAKAQAIRDQFDWKEIVGRQVALYRDAIILSRRRNRGQS